MKVAAITLANGKNTRLGRSKAMEVFDGRNLIERAVEQLRPVTSQLLIVTLPEQSGLCVSGKRLPLVRA